MTKREFVALIAPAVRNATPDAPGIARNLILTHSALETGWGVSRAFREGNSLFNITRDRGSQAPVIVAPDDEYSKDGKTKRKITQDFLAFPSHEASVLHYLKFIDRTRYRYALKELMDCRPEYILTLGKGGFYTLPKGAYYAAFLSVRKDVEAELEQATQS